MRSEEGIQRDREGGWPFPPVSPRKRLGEMDQPQKQHGGKCSCGLPNSKFCMLNLVDAIAKVKSKRQSSWVPLNICSAYPASSSASTTQSAPYTSQELIGSYSTGTDPLRGGTDSELRIGHNTGNLTDRDVVRWKNSNPQPHRPNSHNKEHRQHNKGSVDKDSGVGGGVLSSAADKRGTSPMLLNNGKLLNTSSSSSNTNGNGLHNNNNAAAVSSITNQFKALGMRNNFLSGQQIPTSQAQQQQSPGSSSLSQQPPPARLHTPAHHAGGGQHRSDELIAMGTNWNPPASSSNGGSSGGGGSGLRNSRSHQVAASASNLLLPVGATASRSKNTIRPGMLRQGRQQDEMPRYSDPLPGATLAFQQRLAELASLEQETIRYEKARKFKKKVKDTS